MVLAMVLAMVPCNGRRERNLSLAILRLQNADCWLQRGKVGVTTEPLLILL